MTRNRPASFDLLMTQHSLSLADENELLRAEILSLKAALASYQEQQPSRAAATTPISSAGLSAARKTTLRDPAPSSRGSPPASSRSRSPARSFRKTNRHPSDDFLSRPQDTADETSVFQPTDLDKHTSSRGLKLRKTPSPRRVRFNNNAEKQHNLHTATFKENKNGERRILMPTTDLNEDDQDDMDIETAAFLKANESSPSRTPETSMLSSYCLTADVDMDDVSFDGNELRPFWAAVKDRSGWLVALLILQSVSSFIISRNEKLLQSHLVIVRFLTMLVGAGGNAGNQASVGVIRGLATGTVNDRNMNDMLYQELKMGLALSFVLGVTGAVRAAVFMTPITETIAITTSLGMFCFVARSAEYLRRVLFAVSIVFISVLLGAVLPLAMKFCSLDPAHSSTTIQVIMDILGVIITVREFFTGDYRFARQPFLTFCCLSTQT